MVEFVYGLIKHLTHTLSQIDTAITKEINLYYYKESNLREFLATVHRHCYSLSMSGKEASLSGVGKLC
ncbi:hypothetical protein IGI04_025315 [Brassica rapa subsp. trilocularis]|uniref:Uncharacterized protein n=1 Tax=Brassica rapa subsp. trilocularis TaxID=1813537 RepID=A0ABQ7M9U6_BRACM|nr:hypothetical protein IGI04_025315 [Brassica rapa subsp. trilocularis]